MTKSIVNRWMLFFLAAVLILPLLVVGQLALAQFDISGSVRLDADGDADLVGDTFEGPIPGVSLMIYLDADANLIPDGSSLQISSTDDNGFFSFTNLSANTYLVMENDLSNFVSTADSFGTNDNRINIAVSTGSVSGLLFLDDKRDVLGGPFCREHFLVADSGGVPNDRLTHLDKNFVENSIGPGTGTINIEAIAIDPHSSNVTIVASNDRGAGLAADVGTIDTTTGVYTSVGVLQPVINGILGPVLPRDLDGLTFDPFTGILYGTVRRPGPGDDDLLIQIDVNSASVVSNAFGTGLDYVPIPGTNVNGFPLYDIDDIAVDPEDGQLYGILNAGSAIDVIARIDKKTGRLEVSGEPIGVSDVEGLAFDNEGQLTASTGNATTFSDSFLRIIKTTGMTNSPPIDLDAHVDDGSDYEAVDCLTCWPNHIAGSIFLDSNGNGLYDRASETGFVGVSVNLHRDVNKDHVYDTNDILLASLTTASNGSYSFTFKSTGAFVLNIESNGLPVGLSFTTDNSEAADFHTNRYGLLDGNNNFGLQAPPTADIDVAKNVMPTNLLSGSNFTYVIVVTNTGADAVNNLRVSDVLPEEVAYASSDPAPDMQNGNTNVFIFSQLLAGTSASITMDVSVISALPGTITNWVQGEVDELEITLSNNSAIAIAQIPDTDRDGINNALDKDDDNDGATDEAEQIADTDPLNPDSYLRFSFINRTGDLVGVSWKGGIMATQRIDRSRNPELSDSWETILTNSPPTPITNSALIFELMPSTKTFYRIRILGE